MNTFLTSAPGRFEHGGASYLLADLPALFGERLTELPVVLRLLLENVIRNMSGVEQAAAVDALFRWVDRGTSDAEIAFQPGGVLMHDTTSTPALVDIAAMRDALHSAGYDPTVLNPGLPVDISVDHSLAVEFFAQQDAVERNLAMEMRRVAGKFGRLLCVFQTPSVGDFAGHCTRGVLGATPVQRPAPV